ncbi:MAG: hypothetical protein JKX71_11700 [Amylibacter sp.]|nr:hypothetical protein [Amylibacter sp.]
MSDVIVKIQPSVVRRIFAAIILCISGFVMINFAFSPTAQSILLKLTLICLGLVFLWQALVNFRATDAALFLKREGLFDEHGTLICSLSNIALVERSWFSFKPSNGFLLRLHEPQSRKWVPGFYWRMGRRLGVGGSISPAQTKEMSDKLVLLMQEKAMGIELL